MSLTDKWILEVCSQEGVSVETFCLDYNIMCGC